MDHPGSLILPEPLPVDLLSFFIVPPSSLDLDDGLKHSGRLDSRTDDLLNLFEREVVQIVFLEVDQRVLGFDVLEKLSLLQ